MSQGVINDAKVHMQKTIDATKREFGGIRTGRATPALLERITVDYYGAQTPVNQVATVTAPDPRLLVIQPWDKRMIKEVERAIQKSELGLTPSTDGTVIRLSIPGLTEERRRELVKVVRKHAEEGRVAIRNIRRDHKDKLEQLEKGGKISEDDSRRAVDELQKLTDRYIKEIESLLSAKEAEIMEV
ncbi:MAG: ribosome recycling factor [Armatimonadetes bacterium 13_1_40CM_3_65_7]|nr:MAG: ribosome recycling factor [Armatimonadetes bacterium 13_1_40CM_3_65_7]